MKLPLFQPRSNALNDIAPAVDERSRLGVPSYPSGWFGVAFSHEVAPGEVKRVQFAGREVVAFRTRSGRAAVFEAHCPHLGAHFGHGGSVEGETLRCPMHDFRFDVEGRCTAVGLCHTHLPSARAGALHVRENSGILFAWHHPDGAAPTWEPPQLADAPLTDGPSQRRQLVVRSHVQDLAENLFDVSHLAHVHGYEEPEMERPTPDGHVIRGGSRLFHVTRLGSMVRRVRVDLKTTLHGLGIVLLDSASEPGGFSFRGAFTWNPAGPGVVDFRISIWVKTVDQGLAAMPLFRNLPARTQNDLMGRMLVLTMLRDVRQDAAVLERKRYLLRPGLSDGDAHIAAYRRWAKQFYPEAREQPEVRAPLVTRD